MIRTNEETWMLRSECTSNMMFKLRNDCIVYSAATDEGELDVFHYDACFPEAIVGACMI